MRQLGQPHLQSYNRTYRRSGFLRDGRYRSGLTQEEDCVLGCYRNIELNPALAEIPRAAPRQTLAGLSNYHCDYRFSKRRQRKRPPVESLIDNKT